MDTLGKLLFNLKTIACIPKGARITTAQEFINIEEESTLQPVWRTLSRDSRSKNIALVQQVVDFTILFSDLMMESKYLFLENITIETLSECCDVVFGGAQPAPSERERRITKLKEIACLLDESRIGIENLIETYVDDANVLAILNPLLEKIDTHVNKMYKALMGMGEIIKKRTKF